MKQRLLAILLTLVMLIGLMPISALAADAYTIHYNGNGATSGSMDDQIVPIDNNYHTLNLNQFKKDGYIFAGWFIENDETKTFADGVNLTSPLAEAGGEVTLVAEWTADSANQYTLEFWGKGGTYTIDNTTTNHTKKVTFGQPIGELFEVTRTGYQFKGWFTKAEGGTLKTADSNYWTEDSDNLYAQWIANGYTVKFDGNGATSGSMNDQTFTYDVAQALNANAFQKTGYTFAGWALKEADALTTFADGEVVSNLTAVANGEVTLIAQWAGNEYTIEFNARGGVFTIDGTTENHKKKATFGQPIGELFEVTRTGYQFKGWYTKANGGFLRTAESIYQTPGRDNFYAQWIANGYTVKFDGNGATSGSMNDQTFTYDVAQALNANAFQKTGYTFAGWALKDDPSKTFADGEVVSNLTAVANGEVTLIAQWTPNNYTITYHGNGGKLASNPTKDKTASNVTFNTEVTLKSASTFTRDGYAFVGWSANPDAKYSATPAENEVEYSGSQKITYQISSNIDLYAIWVPVSADYIVNYYTENLDGTYTLLESIKKTDNIDYTGKTVTTVNADIDAPEHYHLNTEKSVTSGELFIPYDEEINGQITHRILTLNVYYDLDTFTVKYVDGIDGIEVFADDVHEGVKYGAATPAFAGSTDRAGLKFLAWSPDVAEKVTEDATYSATWNAQYVVKYYSENFENDDYTLIKEETLWADIGADVTVSEDDINANNPEHHHFLADASTISGKVFIPAVDEDGAITDQLVLTVKYEYDRFTVKYDLNGAKSTSDKYSPKVYKYGATFKIENAPLYIPYNFVGWTIDGKTVYSGRSYTVTKDITVVANWKLPVPIIPPIVQTRANVILTKIDADKTSTVLEDAVFKLYTSTGKFVGRYETNSLGQIKVSLPYGSYYFVEYTAPYGYELDTTKHYFTVSATKDAALTVTNKRLETVEKKDDSLLNIDDHFAYILGYPDGTVRPEATITRAEVATIFFRLLKDDVRAKYLTSYNTFSDVNKDDWFNTAVSTMAAMGILNGYTNGTFKPNGNITRAEFAAIAARFDPNGDTEDVILSDLESHWAKDEVAIAANNGWVKGYDDSTFAPDKEITRAEAMAIVNRVLGRNPQSESDLLRGMTTFSDNADTSKWYYIDVQEATNSHYYNVKINGHEEWTSFRK